jgi:rSAM/selenodomain-associated transferase 2
MRVSVIIPTRNEADPLPLLLDDLEAVRRAGHEVLLVDGGSDDATVRIAKGRVDRILQSPQGRSRQMNTGAAEAGGEVLWFLHADTRVPPGAIDAVERALNQGHCWGRFDVRLSGRQWAFRLIERMMNLRSCLSGIATGDQGIFVTRSNFSEIGGFPDIPLMEDIALSRELRRRQRPCCIRHPRLQTSSRRWETRGIWRTVWLMWRLRLAYALGADPAELARRYR